MVAQDLTYSLEILKLIRGAHRANVRIFAIKRIQSLRGDLINRVQDMRFCCSLINGILGFSHDSAIL